MQTEWDRARLLETGIPPAKVKSLGNIKFDREYPLMTERERRDWLEAFGLSDEDPVWLAGSTHAGEEKIIIDVFEQIRSSFPNLRLLIAPRRLERAEEVRNLAATRGFKVLMRTAIPAGRPSFDVCVLDTMGELGRIYAIAWVSFVGGSLSNRQASAVRSWLDPTRTISRSWPKRFSKPAEGCGSMMRNSSQKRSWTFCPIPEGESAWERAPGGLWRATGVPLSGS